MPCSAELCEQVFDEILDTIVLKIQRQIDESRRIATNYDNESDLQIEVCPAPSSPRILLLTSEIRKGHHSCRRSLTEPLLQEQSSWPFCEISVAWAKACINTDQAVLVSLPTSPSRNVADVIAKQCDRRAWPCPQGLPATPG